MLFEWWERYRRIILTIGALVFIGSSIWLYQVQQSVASTGLPLESPAFASEQLPAKEEPHQSKKQHAEKKEEKPIATHLLVDVKGKVKQPGLYRFESGMRVADAISSAGGSLPDADLEQINLAQPLVDGSAIVIPAKGASPKISATLRPSSGNMGQASPATDKNVNINTASQEELMTLPGIGEARANAILSYRSEKSTFRSKEELKQIEGIGDKMYERIKDRIRIQ